MAWLRDVEGLFLPDLPSLGLLAFGSLAGFRALGPGILRQVHWRPCEVRLELSEEELCIRNHLPLVDPPVFHPCSGSLSVGKGTEHTPPAVPVAAGVGFVKPWVVELLLCTVCQRAGEPKRTSSQVVCVRSFDRAVSAFLDYIKKGRPRGMALSAHFRALPLNKGGFACAKSRRGWLEAWLKNARQRFVRKADVLKSLKSKKRKHF